MRKIGEMIWQRGRARSAAAFLFAFWPLFLFAQDVDVLATVDRDIMGEGDTFTYSISVSSRKSVTVDEPKLPSIEGFELLNSWSASESQSTFSNGSFEVERKQIFNYMLSPRRKGSLSLGEAEVVVEGQTYKTKQIKITVVERQSAPPQAQTPPDPQQDPFSEMEDMFNRLLERRLPRGRGGVDVDPQTAFFIKAEVDKTRAYAGEQVTASWYLYTRANIRDIDTLKYPSLKGFWKEDIEIATRLNFVNEVVNGVPYSKALLASYALFPIKPGRALIDAYKAECVLVLGQFGFGEPRKYTRSSKEIPIEVLALPVNEKPQQFTGAVGQFEVDLKLDSQESVVNQPLTVKIKFSGRGNAKLIDLPKPQLPPSLELYDTKSEAKFFKDGTSYKEFDLLVIPREAGRLVLPPFQVALFNPVKSEYYLKSTSEVALEVKPAVGAEFMASRPLEKGTNPDAKLKPWVMPGPVLEFREARPHQPWKSTAAALMGYLISAALLFLRYRAEFGERQRRRDVVHSIRERMKRVQGRIGHKDWRGVGLEMTNAYYYLLGELSGLGGASRELEQLLLKVPPSVRRELGEDIKKELSLFQMLSFAPEQMARDLQDEKELTKRLHFSQSVMNKAVDLGLVAGDPAGP